MRARLRTLYGEPAAGRTEAALLALIARTRERVRDPAPAFPGFDQADAILIAYGDSFLDPGRPPLGALGRFTGSHLRGLVSTIHVLPFYPYSSDYGFSVQDHLAVDPALGGWADVAALRSRFELMFDVVLNHASVRGTWFERFMAGVPPYHRFFKVADPADDLGSVVRPRTTPLLTRFETAAGTRWVWTTFSADQADLDYANPDVLVRMVEVILTYVEHGADLLRLDAVGYLWKRPGTASIHLPETHQIVRLLRQVLDMAAPHVGLVTETNVPHPENVAYLGGGSGEAQLVYQFPLAPLVLDAFRRGDAGRLAAWAAGLPPPSARATFLNFLASHDGVGVLPARGLVPDRDVAELAAGVLAAGGQVSSRTGEDGVEVPYELNSTWFDALGSTGPALAAEAAIERFACSHAVMLALAGVPGVYVHSLFGSGNDHEGFARSGWKRDLNHARLRLPELEADLARPETRAARVFARMRRLLAARRAEPAFHPGAPQRVLPAPRGVFALERGRPDNPTVICLHNLGPEPAEIDRPGAELVDLLGPAGPVRTPRGRLRLAPYEARWLRVATSDHRPRPPGPNR